MNQEEEIDDGSLILGEDHFEQKIRQEEEDDQDVQEVVGDAISYNMLMDKIAASKAEPEVGGSAAAPVIAGSDSDSDDSSNESDSSVAGDGSAATSDEEQHHQKPKVPMVAKGGGGEG